MSSDSLAAFRRSLGPQLSELAEQHIKHDLTPEDRTTLQSAATTITTHTTLGTLLGLSLGLLLATRIRTTRSRIFTTFRAREQPTSLKFSSGREEPLPDLTPLLKPTRLGDVATFFFCGLGGVFLGGELGLVTGSLRARGVIGGDREGRERIRRAFNAFRVDVLRREAEALERGEGGESAGGRVGGWVNGL